MHAFFRDRLRGVLRDAGPVVAHLLRAHPFVFPAVHHVSFRSIRPSRTEATLVGFGFREAGAVAMPPPAVGEALRTARWFERPGMPRVLSSRAHLSPGQDPDAVRRADPYVDWVLRHGEDAVSHLALDLSAYPVDLQTVLDGLSADLDLATNPVRSDGAVCQGSCADLPVEFVQRRPGGGGAAFETTR